jgi:membrane protease YdiL (CAAX protease family)
VGGLSARLLGWSLFVLVLALLAYGAQLNGDENDPNVAYRWSSSINGLVFYLLVLGIAMLITRGLDRRSFLGLRAPSSWSRAFGISLGILFAVLVASAVVGALGGMPEEEQGLIPEEWNSHRVAQFAAYAGVVAILAPIVEEVMFRGVGYGLLEPFGRTRAVVIVGIAFALIHGLLTGFPVIATFGIGITYLRNRTRSLYPCIGLHAFFNGVGLALGVLT